MKIRTILLMGGLVLLGACSESKYDFGSQLGTGRVP